MSGLIKFRKECMSRLFGGAELDSRVAEFRRFATRGALYLVTTNGQVRLLHNSEPNGMYERYYAQPSEF